jgi:hypothetical protein
MPYPLVAAHFQSDRFGELPIRVDREQCAAELVCNRVVEPVCWLSGAMYLMGVETLLCCGFPQRVRWRWGISRRVCRCRGGCRFRGGDWWSGVSGVDVTSRSRHSMRLKPAPGVSKHLAVSSDVHQQHRDPTFSGIRACRYFASSAACLVRQLVLSRRGRSLDVSAMIRLCISSPQPNKRRPDGLSWAMRPRRLPAGGLRQHRSSGRCL